MRGLLRGTKKPHEYITEGVSVTVKSLRFLTRRATLMRVVRRLDGIVVFFALLLGVTVSSLFFFNDSKNEEVAREELALLELRGWQLYELGDSVNTDLKGKSARKYADREVYEEFEIQKISDGAKEILSGNLALRKGDDYEFPNGVEYMREPGTHFFSEAGTYNMKEEIFRGRGKFSMMDPSNRTTGRNISYDRRLDVLNAEEINASILRFQTKK